jgi:hypothetical protein
MQKEHARAKLTSEQPFDHQCAYMCVCAHTHTQEREEEDVNKVYTHVHTHICAAGELQRTDSKEWIDERTDEQMARPRTFFLSCRVRSTCIDTLIA